MEPQGQRARLEDVINYKPDEYFSEGEISLIQSTFKDNPLLFKVLRKALIPSVADLELPIEQFGNDTFTQGREYAQVPESELKSIVVARQDAIKFIAGGLIKLRVIANMRTESPEQAVLRREKDSTK